MKQNKIIFRVVLILALIATVMIIRKSTTTIKKELRDFAIADTASVTKIFLADKTGLQVLLEKKAPGEWMVNSKFKARNESIDLLLYTMWKLEVKNPVANAAKENVFKQMAANATKVEIYQDNRLSKTYYVGGATQDQLGTFMLMENSSAPFVMYLQNLNGYLTTRYFTDENQWRSRVIFNLKPDEIKSVSLEYPANPENSFVLNNKGNKNFTLAGTKEQPALELKDDLNTLQFLSVFSNLQYELVVSQIKQQKKDSVLASTPLFTLKVTDTSGKQRTVKCFKMPVNEHSTFKEDENGALKYDVDRMYALIDNTDFVIVQYFVFEKVSRKYGDFTSVQFHKGI